MTKTSQVYSLNELMKENVVLCVFDTTDYRILELSLPYDLSPNLNQEKTKKSPCLLDFIHPDEQSKTKSALWFFLNGEASSFETRLIDSHGNEFWFSWSGRVDQIKKIFYGVGKNISDLRSLKNELDVKFEQNQEFVQEIIQAELKFSVLFKESTDGLLLLDENGFLECNPTALQMLGVHNQSEALQKTLLNFSPLKQEDGRLSKDVFEYYSDRAKTKGFARFEWSLQKPKQEPNYIVVTLKPIDVAGKSQIMMVFHDLNDDKKQKKFIEEITRAVPSIIFVISVLEFKTIFLSSAIADILGHSRQSITQQKRAFLTELCHPEDLHKLQNFLTLVMSKKDEKVSSIQIRMKHFNGQWIWCSIRMSSFRKDGLGSVVELIGVISDINQQIKLSESLEKEKIKHFSNAKMASLGEMAAGISHEINNPLTIILGTASLLKSDAKKENFESEKYVKNLDKIIQTVGRITKIIKGLRSFARDGDKDEFSLNSIEKIVSETVEICRERFYLGSTKIEVSPISHSLMLQCRGVQINQVILNLLGNAFDAVQGQIEKWVRIEIQDKGSSIDIIVADSGPGIPPSLREKIMQPFFTTKEVGKGTGLGLSISKGIIEDHGGQFFLDDSSPFTRFVITLPKQQLQKIAA